MSPNDLHEEPDTPVVALVADLMFASRIRGPAPGSKTVHSPAALIKLLGPGARLVLIDLHTRGALEAIPAARAAAPGATIVAFGSHVETDALTAARDAGADRVMARSAFVRELPGLVQAAGG